MRYSQMRGLHVPIMALIDYRGYRLIAESILPIKDKTLLYGSKDKGETVIAINPDLNLYVCF